MKNIFRDKFEELGIEYAERFPDDETELPPNDFLHWYGGELTAEEISFIENMIRRWNALADEYRRFYVCAVCQTHRHPIFFDEYAGGVIVCKTCRKNGNFKNLFMPTLF